MTKSKEHAVKKKTVHLKSTSENGFGILKNSNWLIRAFILFVVGFISYYPSLQNSFTNWDDGAYVVDNDMLINLNMARIFSETVCANYHPITMLSLGLNYDRRTASPVYACRLWFSDVYRSCRTIRMFSA